MDNLAEEDVPALKLVQLRAALQSRGLDEKGDKAELVARLTAAVRSGPDAAAATVGTKRRLESHGDAPLAKRHVPAAGGPDVAEEDGDEYGPAIPVGLPPHVAAVAHADEEYGPPVPHDSTTPVTGAATRMRKPRKGRVE